MTNIEIAKTILHECFHAYLMIKALNPSVGQPIPGAANMTVQQIMNAIYPNNPNNPNPETQAQHIFMFNNLLPTMEVILNQMLPILTTLPSRSICEAIGIDHNQITNPNVSSTTWVWNDYIKYLSQKGFESCSSFINLYQININSNNQISGGNDNFGIFNQYNSIGELFLENSIIP